MKHVTECYGQRANELILTSEEYFNVIDPFLLALGVRSRVCKMWTEDGQSMVQVEAGNLYKDHITGHDRDFVESLMTPDRIAVYKR